MTRSEEGMTLYTPRHGAATCAGLSGQGPRRVGRRRYGGRGDGGACSRLEADFELATRAANAAAAVVVGKRGTSTVSAAELRSRLLPAASLAPEEKIVFDWSVLDERLHEWRGRACASASPMAASISCIPATSSC